MSVAAKTRKVTQAVITGREIAVKAMCIRCLELEPWERSSRKETWLRADTVFNLLRSEKPTTTYRFIADNVGCTKPQVITLVRKIKAGWNPSLDPSWLLFKEAYQTLIESKV